MELKHARMMATFVNDATNYDNCSSLAESLSYAWTSVCVGLPDADMALIWLRKNVILLTPVQNIHVSSPVWLETAGDVPLTDGEPAYGEDENWDYENPQA